MEYCLYHTSSDTLHYSVFLMLPWDSCLVFYISSVSPEILSSHW